MKNQISVNDHAAFRKSLSRRVEIEAMWGDLDELEHMAATEKRLAQEREIAELVNELRNIEPPVEL